LSARKQLDIVTACREVGTCATGSRGPVALSEHSQRRDRSTPARPRAEEPDPSVAAEVPHSRRQDSDEAGDGAGEPRARLRRGGKVLAAADKGGGSCGKTSPGSGQEYGDRCWLRHSVTVQGLSSRQTRRTRGGDFYWPHAGPTFTWPWTASRPAVHAGRVTSQQAKQLRIADRRSC